MKNKDVTLYCRVTPDMKDRVEQAAAARGESVSVIVRDALRAYFPAEPATLRETPAPYGQPAATPPAPAPATPAPAAAPAKMKRPSKAARFSTQ